MKTWNSFKNCEEEYIPTHSRYTESETDKSKFRPNISRLNDAIGASMPIDKSCYEFEDGKDTGERQYILRSKAVDITEKQEYLKNIKDRADVDREYIKDELQKTLEEMKQKQNVTDSKNSVDTPTTTTNSAI